MPRIEAICVSDLHLGSATSVLTAIDPWSLGPDINRISPVLESFVQCLKSILRSHEGKEKPRLVFAGDVLEFALATDNVAAIVFAQFARLLLDDPGLPIDHSLIYVPGNHDHHLWETARESQYVSYLNEPTTTVPLTNVPWHATHLFPWGADKTATSRDVDSCLLTTLLKLVNPPESAAALAATSRTLFLWVNSGGSPSAESLAQMTHKRQTNFASKRPQLDHDSVSVFSLI